MSRLTRGGTTEPVSRGQILRRERGQGKNHFPCSAHHVQDWQPYPVNPYSCYMCDHTYIHGCESCSWLAEQGICIFPCPHSRLMIIWSRETGSAVPSRVSPLTLHTRPESDWLVFIRGTPPPLSATTPPYTVKRHPASPEFIRLRNWVPTAFTAESPPGQGQ